LPALRDEVLKEAWPEPFTATFEDKTVVPSLNVTVPTGTPLPDVVTDVNVTDWPTVEGFGEELTVVVVAVLF
jgi:hypothetical protein